MLVISKLLYTACNMSM